MGRAEFRQIADYAADQVEARRTMRSALCRKGKLTYND